MIALTNRAAMVARVMTWLTTSAAHACRDTQEKTVKPVRNATLNISIA